MINFIVKYQKLSFSIYYWLLVIIAVSMPFSPFLMSLGQILLLLNWIAEGNFDEKWRILKIRKVFGFLLLFI